MITFAIGARTADHSRTWLIPVVFEYPDAKKRARELIRIARDPEGFLPDLVQFAMDNDIVLAFGSGEHLVDLVVPEAGAEAILAGAEKALTFSAIKGQPGKGAFLPCGRQEFDSVIPGAVRGWHESIIAQLTREPTDKLLSPSMQVSNDALANGTYALDWYYATLPAPPAFLLRSILLTTVLLGATGLREAESHSSRFLMQAAITGLVDENAYFNHQLISKLLRSDRETIKLMVDRYGFDPAERWTSMLAIDGDKPDVIRYLIEDGRAKPDPLNSEIMRAVESSTNKHAPEMLKVMLEAGYYRDGAIDYFFIAKVMRHKQCREILEAISFHPEVEPAVHEAMLRALPHHRDIAERQWLLSRYAHLLSDADWGRLFSYTYNTENDLLLADLIRLYSDKVKACTLHVSLEGNAINEGRLFSCNKMLLDAKLSLSSLTAPLLEQPVANVVKQAVNSTRASALLRAVMETGQLQHERLVEGMTTAANIRYLIRHAPDPASLIAHVPKALRATAMDALVQNGATL